MAKKEGLTRFLGWFSIGLGVAQVTTPGGVARLIGVGDKPENRTGMIMLGVREIVSGVGILVRRKPTGWVWARVAGDAMDLVLLTSALNSKKAQREKVRAALGAVAGITLLDLRQSLKLGRKSTTNVKEDHSMQVKRTLTVNRSPEEVYQFWHDFQNLPRFMKHLESVQVFGEKRSHWKTKAPAGKTVEWDAEITDDRPNELIAWHSLKGADIDNSGSVQMERATGGRGTVVTVEMSYDQPGGALGKTIAKLFGEAPEQQVLDDLRAFKQVMETGEVLVSDATYHGHPHPAQPPAADASR